MVKSHKQKILKALLKEIAENGIWSFNFDPNPDIPAFFKFCSPEYDFWADYNCAEDKIYIFSFDQLVVSENASEAERIFKQIYNL